MVFLTLSDFRGGSCKAACALEPLSPAQLPDPAGHSSRLALWWETPPSGADAQQYSPYGSSLLVPEHWHSVLPQAELLISSSISGGDLRNRFQSLAAAHSCWLVPERLCRAFPLPCPDGQGTPLPEPPQAEGFYSPSLGCRYLHWPDHVILFDTEQTLEQKILLAKECGFRGVVSVLPDQP